MFLKFSVLLALALVAAMAAEETQSGCLAITVVNEVNTIKDEADLCLHTRRGQGDKRLHEEGEGEYQGPD